MKCIKYCNSLKFVLLFVNLRFWRIFLQLPVVLSQIWSIESNWLQKIFKEATKKFLFHDKTLEKWDNEMLAHQNEMYFSLEWFKSYLDNQICAVNFKKLVRGTHPI